uniref:Uncharacterized protein n=1 Tax=Romanomermis culicivorax TaxID=13658 RepID=A0A915I9K1_ROMCU
MSMPNYNAAKNAGTVAGPIATHVPGPSLWQLAKKHARTNPELWPLYFLGVCVGGTISFMAFWSFRKTEVVVKHHQEYGPMHWSRAKDYYGRAYRLGDLVRGVSTGDRIPELEQIQQEMLEVEQQRKKEAKENAHKHGGNGHH